MTCSSSLSAGASTQSVALLELVALVDEQRGVAAVIDDELGAEAALVRESLRGTPPVFFERLALPGEDGNAGGSDGGGGVVLGGEDVAARPSARRRRGRPASR